MCTSNALSTFTLHNPKSMQVPPTPNRSCNCCWLFTPYRISMPRVKQWQLIGLVCSAWSKCRCQVGCIPASSIRPLICVQSFLTHNRQRFFKFRNFGTVPGFFTQTYDPHWIENMLCAAFSVTVLFSFFLLLSHVWGKLVGCEPFACRWQGKTWDVKFG